MSNYKTLEDVIGATPLVRLQRIGADVAQARGKLFRMGHKRLEVVDRHAGVDHQHIGRATDHRDRGEVLDGIPTCLAEKMRVSHLVSTVSQQKRVPIGSSLGDQLVTNIA